MRCVRRYVHRHPRRTPRWIFLAATESGGSRRTPNPQAVHAAHVGIAIAGANPGLEPSPRSPASAAGLDHPAVGDGLLGVVDPGRHDGCDGAREVLSERLWRASVICVLLVSAACADRERATRRSQVDDAASASSAPLAQVSCDSEWREVAPGLRRRSLCADGEPTLHHVEVDPKRWVLDAVRVPPATAPAVAHDRDAAFVINASFFDPERKPLGVIVSDGTMLQRPHPVSWQSIFSVSSDGKSSIVLPERWAEVHDGAAMAVQAGPRLVVDGRSTGAARGKPSLRSGICITADDRVTFFVTTMSRLYDVDEMTDLAGRSEDRGGLGCRDAMLFDGGPSAQMHLADSDISIEGDRVPAFVIARRR